MRAVGGHGAQDDARQRDVVVAVEQLLADEPRGVVGRDQEHGHAVFPLERRHIAFGPGIEGLPVDEVVHLRAERDGAVHVERPLVRPLRKDLEVSAPGKFGCPDVHALRVGRIRVQVHEVDGAALAIAQNLHLDIWKRGLTARSRDRFCRSVCGLTRMLVFEARRRENPKVGKVHGARPGAHEVLRRGRRPHSHKRELPPLVSSRRRLAADGDGIPATPGTARRLLEPGRFEHVHETQTVVGMHFVEAPQARGGHRLARTLAFERREQHGDLRGLRIDEVHAVESIRDAEQQRLFPVLILALAHDVGAVDELYAPAGMVRERAHLEAEAAGGDARVKRLG